MPRDPSLVSPSARDLMVLFETVPLGVAILDRDLRYVQLNDRLATLNGLDAASAIGMPVEDVLPTAGSVVRGLLQQVIETGAAMTKVAITGVRAPGIASAPLHVEADFHPLKNENGEVTGILAMVRDTTFEIETREAIEAERARVVGAVRAVGGLAFEWDLAADTIEWGEGLTRLTGFAAEDFEPGSRGWLQHVMPDDVAKIREATQHYLTTGINLTTPYRFRRKDGRIVWFATTVDWVRDGRGGRVFGLVRDVSEQVRASEDLRASEERFRLLADFVPDLIWTANKDGVTDWLNERWRQLTGTSLPRGTSGWASLIHPEDFDALVPAWVQAVETGANFEREYRLRGRDGKYRWFLGRATPMRDETGAIVKWLGTATDVHDYRLALDHLRAAEDQRRLALEAGRIGAFQWRAEGNVLTFSPEAQVLLGLPQRFDAAAPEQWRSNIHPEDRSTVKAMTEAAVAALAPSLQMEFRILLDRAAPRWIESRGSIEYDGAGKPRRTSGVFVDITARKQQEEKINLLLREMHHRVKNAFAMIAALVSLSAKSAKDVKEYSQALRGRVQSLAIAHALSFADTENESVGVLELMRQLLVPFTLENDPRVSLSGSPRLRIAERQVSSLALALHELATNSVKHGALKDMQGRLSILIEPTAEIGGAGIAIRWRETGATPPAKAGVHTGFGSVLIERSMQQVNAQLRRRWEGERYLVDLIIPQ